MASSFEIIYDDQGQAVGDIEEVDPGDWHVLHYRTDWWADRGVTNRDFAIELLYTTQQLTSNRRQNGC